MANPLACSIALASTGLLIESDWRGNLARIEGGLETGLEAARDLEGVSDVRVLGGIGVIQLDDPVDMEAATEAAVAHGVWLRPFRDLIYTMPPYVTGDEDLALATEAMTHGATASLTRARSSSCHLYPNDAAADLPCLDPRGTRSRQ